MPTNSKGAGVLVHLGAGQCSELAQYIALRPQSLLLIEADPQIAHDLQARAAEYAQLKVICAAVSGHPGPAILHRYNLPGASSLHPATGLKKLFPGLKETGRIKVEAVTPDSLFRSLNLQNDFENTLVIDLPGEELPILQSLLKSELLYLFSRLYLNCGREPLYEGSTTAQSILQWLEKHGYVLLRENNLQDPDRPCWALQLNKLHFEIRTLHTAIIQIKLERDEAIKEKDEHAHLLQESSKREKTLEAEKTQLEKKLSALEQARDEQRILAGNYLEQINQIKDELRKTQQSANLAIKLQMLRESDLKDLQQRYSEVVSTQEQQHILLNKLEDRLRLAASYFRQLCDQHSLNIASSELLEIDRRITNENKATTSRKR